MSNSRKSPNIGRLCVASLIDLYLVDGPTDKPCKRETSWATDRLNLERHVKPLIGTRKANEIQRSDIGRLIKSITIGATAGDIRTRARGRSIVRGGPAAAARATASLRAMFTWAIHRGLLNAPNPASGIRLPPTDSLERYLNVEEAQRLFRTLSELEAAAEISAQQAAIIRILLLTGARRNEISGLKWSEVHLERGVLELPPSRSKAGGTSGRRRIYLNAAAVEVIKTIPRGHRDDWVFPASKGTNGPTTSTSSLWRTKIAPRAKLTGVRVHDLRHSFASFALANGASLSMIGKALGHASVRSTERYAHLSEELVRSTCEGVSTLILGVN